MPLSSSKTSMVTVEVEGDSNDRFMKPFGIEKVSCKQSQPNAILKECV